MMDGQNAHKNIKTTEIYTHVTSQAIKGLKSPQIIWKLKMKNSYTITCVFRLLPTFSNIYQLVMSILKVDGGIDVSRKSSKLKVL